MADTLEELRRETRAYLGKEPNAFLYLTDADNRVYEIVSNEKHQAALEIARRHTTISVALLTLCLTCLLGASGGSLGGWAVVCFFSVGTLYALILRARLFNEVEGFIVCEILLILALMVIPVLVRVHNITAEPGAAVVRSRD